MTFDEHYGSKMEFLRQLDARGQLFIGEVPCSFYAWTKKPRTTMKRGKQGRKRIKPRLVKGQAGTIEVRNTLKYSPVLRDQPWVKYAVKETDKGPIIWEVKECTIYIRCESRGAPIDQPFRLIVARNVLNDDEEEIKYFVTNAQADVSLSELLLVAFSRRRVERSFQDSKQKLGLDHFETRTYTGFIRHLLLCSLAYYFLQLQWLERSKKKRSVDVLPGFAIGGDGIDAAADRIAYGVCECVLSASKHHRGTLSPTNTPQANRTAWH